MYACVVKIYPSRVSSRTDINYDTDRQHARITYDGENVLRAQFVHFFLVIACMQVVNVNPTAMTETLPRLCKLVKYCTFGLCIPFWIIHNCPAEWTAKSGP